MPGILLLGMLLLNTLVDVFFGALAFGSHNFMTVGVLAIACAIQGMFMTKIAKNLFYL
jgi:hypothetical protein